MKILPSKDAILPGIVIGLLAIAIVSRIPQIRKIVTGQE